MQRHAFITFSIVLVAVSGALAKKEPAIPTTATTPKQVALVRVNVTGQGYDYFRPWQKKAPFSKRALGAVLPKGRVLVTADLVTNQNYVELERAESGEKTAANVRVIDYESNLALLEPAEKSFLDGITPLEITSDTVVGDRLAAWQLEPTGALLATEGLVTTVQMMPYPIDVGNFLTYRVSIPMQYRENSYTVPLVKNNKLAGLLLRYDSRSQLLDVIPAPVITHFLKEAEGQNYRGFPSAGFSFFPTRDPALREFAGEKGKRGVYITNVEAGTPANKAGMKEGDIVTAVGNHDIDENGNYVDPLYGKIEFTNLLTAHAYAGDVVPFQDSARRQTNAAKRDSGTSRREGLRECAVFPRSTAALLRSWRPDFSGAIPPVSQRMGTELATRSAPAPGLHGPFPIRAFSGEKSPRRHSQPGPSGQQHNRLR